MEFNSPMRASIIVLCYNSLEDATRPCLESILKNTPAGEYELIIVDNASNDGTAEYLNEFASRHENVRIQLNDVNKGYAGGNNDGISLATGRFIILLNNDTLVPIGWLDKLLYLFEEHPKIGLIGPVTNSAGNEQRIELDKLNEKNYEAISEQYIKRQSGVWFEADKLGFFCVAIRRSVIERIGLLDEKFGIGMFEDDDYCIRAKSAGFTLAIAEDCYVFHKGSVSFGKLAINGFQDLFNKNKELLQKKNKYIWTLSDIALSYLERISRDIKKNWDDSDKDSLELERVISRLDNFEHLLVQLHAKEMEIECSSLEIKKKNFGVASRSRWRTRIFNFKRNIIRGSSAERWRYVKYILKRIFFKVGLIGEDKDKEKVLSALMRIREPGLKIIVFPATVDFTYMRQRPQGIAEAFSNLGYVVVYGTLNRQTDEVNILDEISSNLFLLNEKS